MSHWTISWLPTAEDQLADIWLLAADRRAVTLASWQIEAELAVDPATKGAEVAEGLRQLTVPPLRAYFEVHELDRKVEITAERGRSWPHAAEGTGRMNYSVDWKPEGPIMSEIILTEEQVNIVTQAFGTVLVRDTKGQVLGHIEPKLTPAMIAELKRRAASPGPFYTGQQVQARLKALQEEWDWTGGFDEAYMQEFLTRLDAADPGHMRPKGKAG